MKQLENLKKWQGEGVWPPKTLDEAEVLLGRKKNAAAAKGETSVKTKKGTGSV